MYNEFEQQISPESLHEKLRAFWVDMDRTCIPAPITEDMCVMLRQALPLLEARPTLRAGRLAVHFDMGADDFETSEIAVPCVDADVFCTIGIFRNRDGNIAVVIMPNMLPPSVASLAEYSEECTVLAMYGEDAELDDEFETEEDPYPPMMVLMDQTCCTWDIPANIPR